MFNHLNNLRKNTFIFLILGIAPYILNPIIKSFDKVNFTGLNPQNFDSLYSYLPVATLIGIFGLDYNLIKNYSSSLNQRSLILKTIFLSIVGTTITGGLYAYYYSPILPNKSLVLAILVIAVTSGVNIMIYSIILKSEKYLIYFLGIFFYLGVSQLLRHLISGWDYSQLYYEALSGVSSVIFGVIMIIIFVKPNHQGYSMDFGFTQIITLWIFANIISSPFSLTPKLAGRIVKGNSEMITSYGVRYITIYFVLSHIIINPFLVEVTKPQMRDEPRPLFKRSLIYGFSLFFLAGVLLNIFAMQYLSYYNYSTEPASVLVLRLLTIAAPLYLFTTMVNCIFIAQGDKLSLLLSTAISFFLVNGTVVATSGLGGSLSGIGWPLAYLIYALLLSVYLYMRGSLHRTKSRVDVA